MIIEFRKSGYIESYFNITCASLLRFSLLAKSLRMCHTEGEIFSLICRSFYTVSCEYSLDTALSLWRINVILVKKRIFDVIQVRIRSNLRVWFSSDLASWSFAKRVTINRSLRPSKNTSPVSFAKLMMFVWLPEAIRSCTASRLLANTIPILISPCEALLQEIERCLRYLDGLLADSTSFHLQSQCL